MHFFCVFVKFKLYITLYNIIGDVMKKENIKPEEITSIIKKEIDAKQFIISLGGKEAQVEEVKKTKQKENAPLLFNLAEIQNECTKRFKIKPDETLDVIQSLYEKKPT